MSASTLRGAGQDVSQVFQRFGNNLCESFGLGSLSYHRNRIIPQRFTKRVIAQAGRHRQSDGTGQLVGQIDHDVIVRNEEAIPQSARRSGPRPCGVGRRRRRG